MPGEAQPAETEWTTLSDLNENAFTVDMPKGWDSKISLVRQYGQTRNCGVTTSPDGKIRLFFGDPSIPSFNVPMPELGMYENMPTGNPLSQVSRFIPAGRFFSDYAGMAHGKKSGFKIVSVTTDKELQEEYEKAFTLASGGNTANTTITTARVLFEYTDNGHKVSGALNGVTYLLGTIWGVECSGYTAAGDLSEQAETYRVAMLRSFKINPQWRQKEDQAFAARMEANRQQNNAYMQQMTNAHNQRMSDMNASFNAHQSRMQNMQASHDAWNQSWSNNQAMQDRQHGRTIDMIRGEEQVRSGNQYGKVESGYNHYYVNPNTGQYFGTNSPVQSLPENYQEWQIDDRR